MTLPNSLESRFQDPDVVVIGCGAGGAVVAKQLGEAGLTTVVLEAGPRFDPLTSYRTDRRDFEVVGLDVFSNGDSKRDVYTTGGSLGFNYTRVKGVGGSTLAYGAVTPRLHESDFQARSEDGVAEDWPISYEDLEPYYTAVEYQLGVAGTRGNPFDPPRSLPYPTSPHALNAASEAIKKGADELGLHLVPAPVAIPTRAWDGRPACMGVAACELGCKIATKGGTDVTFVRKAERTGRVEIRTNCTAREIRVGPEGRAQSVVYFDANAHEQEVRARVFVLAGNAVETPRLLLMSTSSTFPHGVANSSGLVGKHFTEHLGAFIWAAFAERLLPLDGPIVPAMIQDDYATDRRNDFARGWTTVVVNRFGWPLSVARRLRGWGAEHKARVKRLFGHLVALGTVAEQLPDARNTVTLDPALRDSHGLPVPRITNEPRKNDRAMLKAISVRLKEILRAAGAVEIGEFEYQPGGSKHYVGTCRMGRDARTSIVDPWCRAHDVENLFIADGSVFVTVGAVNPALTIMALAMRTADGIVEAFKRGEF